MILSAKQYPILFVILVSIVVLYNFFFIFFQIKETVFVGYADPAAYGHVASNIIAGRGPVQDFVDFFFEKVPHITHSSDHWYSAYTLCLIPFISLFGKSAFSVKLFTACSYPVLLLLVFFTMKRLYSLNVAILTTLSFAVNAYVLEYSMNGWPDLPFTMIFFMVLLSYLHSEKEEWHYYLLPILVFILCWFRSAGFLLLPGLVIDFLFGAGLRKERFKRWPVRYCVVASTLGLGLLIGGSELIPGNQQSHLNLAATMGYEENPQSEHWQLFWSAPPPSLAQRFTESGTVKKFLRELSALLIQRDYFERNPPLITLVTLPLFLSSLFFLLLTLKKRRSRLILSVFLWYVIGLALLFKMNSRYLFPVQILLIGAGWKGILVLLESTFRGFMAKSEGPEKWGSKLHLTYGTVFVLIVLLFLPGYVDFLSGVGKADSQFPLTDDYALLAAFEQTRHFIGVEDAVMCNLPWSYTFHTNRKSVMVPYGNVADMFEVIKRFQIRWFVDFSGGGRFFLGQYQEFEAVHSFEKMTLYRIRLHRGSGRGAIYLNHNWRLFEW